MREELSRAENKVAWFTVSGGKWVLDLSALRTSFRLDEERFAWLDGAVVIEPEYDVLPDSFNKAEMRGVLALVLDRAVLQEAEGASLQPSGPMRAEAKPMYNLLVSGHDEAWDDRAYLLDFDRYLEYTEAALAARIRALDDHTIKELSVLPTLFAYEARVNRDARVGWIESVVQRQGKIRLTFKFDPAVEPVPPDRIEALRWELDIGKYELNRTHWAVKEVDLLAALRGETTSSSPGAPPYRASQPTPIGQNDGGTSGAAAKRWTSSLPDPPVTRVMRSDLPSSVEVVIVVATDVERESMLRHMSGTSRGQAIRLAHAGSETYYVGTCGAASVALLMCEAGTSRPGAATLAVADAIDEWSPRAVIMPGIAFGRDATKQHVGDVLVAEHVAPYELQRVGEETTIHRAPKPRASTTLLNRFRNASDWRFSDSTGRACVVRLGEVLSGEKLVDNAALRAKLFEAFPSAIGGEMEGVGLFAASERRHVAWLLAKAVCDFGADKHDDDQPLAAAAAAALVAHVLADPGALDGLPRPEARTNLAATSPQQPTDTPPPDVVVSSLSDGTSLSDGAIKVMGWLAAEYVKASYPNFKVWRFTPSDQNDPIYGELRALGLLYFGGPRGGPWRLTQSGLDWVMRNRKI